VADIPPSQPVALLPDFDQGADARLAWIPESNQTATNMPPASRLTRVTGCFIDQFRLEHIETP
jgi:hypothetical protein